VLALVQLSKGPFSFCKQAIERIISTLYGFTTHYVMFLKFTSYWIQAEHHL